MTTLLNTKYLNSSLTQKSIRRGLIEYALRGAESLARIDHTYLVRRMGTIVLEDIGLANPELLQRYLQEAVDHLKTKPTPEASLTFALPFVEEFCRSIKSRALTEISFTAHCHPHYKALSFELGWLSPEELAGRLESEADPIAAACIRKLLFKRPSGVHVRGTLETLNGNAKALRTEGINHAICDLSKIDGYIIERPSVAPTAILSDWPSYTFDKHTRIGTRALHQFLKLHMPELHHLPAGLAWQALYLILFEVETGVLDRHVVAPGQDWVKVRFWECVTPPGHSLEDMLAWCEVVRSRLHLLDECRAAALATSHNPSLSEV